MDTLQAKQILAAYPVGKKDVDDAQFREALALVDKDEALREWLMQEQAFDEAFAEKLASFSPPERLKERILSDHTLFSKRLSEIDNRSYRNILGNKWLQPFAIAACFIAITFIGFNLIKAPNSPIGINDFIAGVVEYDAYANLKEFEPGDWFLVAETLEKNNTPVLHSVPVKFQNTEVAGCLSFKHKDHPVSLLCIKKGEDKFYHLYIIDLEGADKFKPIPQPTFKVFNERPAATWTDQSHLNIMLVNDNEQESLKQLL